MKKTLYFAIMALLFGSSIAVKAQEKSPCPTITVDGHTYVTNPCSINLNMIAGKEDREFTFSIVPDDFITYSFSVYGFGFPAQSVESTTSSGSARGTQFITVKVTNSKLPLEYNGKRKIYRGYLPINIYKGSKNANDTIFLKLPVTITVKPAPKPIKK